ncbi:hypothetical protein SL617_27890 [Klebsiella michiganensis]|uniref:hypothetical protein n=1 Tax=Klebsiella michiganensis TaxID=1134687 RepID=UPI0038625405
MTKSTITRERLEEIRDYDTCVTLEESAELARMALAAMDSESHTDDELSNLLWYSQEATCHSDPNYYCEFQRLATPGLIAGIIRELHERRKADSEPVADVVAWSHPNEERKCDIRWRRHDVEPGPLYRHAQPAPVVGYVPLGDCPYDVPYSMPSNLRELIAKEIGILFSDDDAQGVWNVCRRAAMLNGGKS